jgi:ribosomal protein S18 acetylase RimI-like enzyme
MKIRIRQYKDSDLSPMIDIWNQVVEEGVAFPQLDYLDDITGQAFFEEQTYTAVAEDEDTHKIHGLYILHPNNIGRCGHICNASYAVGRDSRGQQIGEKLVVDCLEQGKKHGFQILQFNAVVASNTRARRLYERLGFQQLGVIPGGFFMKDGHYEDICPYYHLL